MRKLKKLWQLFPVTILLFYGCQQAKALSDAEKLARFFNKNSVNIIVTDSGLGGVSVAADVYERMKESGVFEEVNVIFFNAQPHIKSGYNSMNTTEQKAAIFDNALNAMQENFKPDIILIACNTLSVVYPYTKYAATSSIPVIGIVETGVNQIKAALDNDPEARVLIFATKTTISQESHKKKLLQQGIDENRIVPQACPRLAGAIERGTHSEETTELVSKYVKQALENTPDDDKPLYASFNCTHYGYIGDVFDKTFADNGRPAAKLIDPNPKMADFIFTDKYLHRYPDTKLDIKVLSQPELNEKRIESIGSLIAKTSPQTAQAMKEYKFTPDMFEWESIAKQNVN